MSLYLRIEKSVNIDIPDGMTYQQAIDYAHQMDADGDLEFDLFIDVMDEGGEVVNETGWEELK